MDLAILLFIQEHLRTPLGDFIIPWISRLGDLGFIWIIIIALMLFNKDTRQTGVVMLVAAMITTLVAEGLIKHLVERPRPFTLYPIEPLVSPPSGYSFPSGHSASSFAVATAYGLMQKNNLRYVLLALATAIALSRLYVFVHYPTDVLCGVLFGIVSAYLAKRLVTDLYPRLSEHRRD